MLISRLKQEAQGDVSLLKEDGSEDKDKEEKPYYTVGFITIRFTLNIHKRLFHVGPTFPG